MVTLIILLILAGISITVLFGENGIIKTAQEAGEAWNESAQKERDDLANLEQWLNEDQWYTYTLINGGKEYKIAVKDKTLSSYGNMKSSIRGIPVTSWRELFKDCINLTEFSFSGIDSSKITDMRKHV